MCFKQSLYYGQWRLFVVPAVILIYEICTYQILTWIDVRDVLVTL